MALFQNSVLNHHIKSIDNGEVQTAYQFYQKEFLPKDGEIDDMVYGLYGLSEEEIAVVER